MPPSTQQLFSLLSKDPELPTPVQCVVRRVCAQLTPASTTATDTESVFNQQMIKLCLANQQREAVNRCVERAQLIQSG